MAVVTAAAIGAVGSIAGGLFSSGSGDASKLQRRAINRSQPIPTSINIPGVGNTSVSGGKENFNVTQGANQFTDLSNIFASQSKEQLNNSTQPLFDIGQTGFSPESIGQSQQGIQDQFGNLRGALNDVQSFDQDAFATQQFDRLQGLASRGESIAADRLANSLFSSGRLGQNDTGTGRAFEGLARSQEDARTQRGLQSFQLADQAFQQKNQIAQNEFGALQSQFGNAGLQLQGFQGLQGLLSANQQQGVQNSLGFAQGANSALDPNFRSAELATQARLTDQANRVSAATGAAGAAAPLIAQGRQSQQDAIGNVFGGVASALGSSKLNIFGGKQGD